MSDLEEKSQDSENELSEESTQSQSSTTPSFTLNPFFRPTDLQSYCERRELHPALVNAAFESMYKAGIRDWRSLSGVGDQGLLALGVPAPTLFALRHEANRRAATAQCMMLLRRTWLSVHVLAQNTEELPDVDVQVAAFRSRLKHHLAVLQRGLRPHTATYARLALLGLLSSHTHCLVGNTTDEGGSARRVAASIQRRLHAMLAVAESSMPFAVQVDSCSTLEDVFGPRDANTGVHTSPVHAGDQPLVLIGNVLSPLQAPLLTALNQVLSGDTCSFLSGAARRPCALQLAIGSADRRSLEAASPLLDAFTFFFDSREDSSVHTDSVWRQLLSDANDGGVVHERNAREQRGGGITPAMLVCLRQRAGTTVQMPDSVSEALCTRIFPLLCKAGVAVDDALLLTRVVRLLKVKAFLDEREEIALQDLWIMKYMVPFGVDTKTCKSLSDEIDALGSDSSGSSRLDASWMESAGISLSINVTVIDDDTTDEERTFSIVLKDLRLDEAFDQVREAIAGTEKCEIDSFDLFYFLENGDVEQLDKEKTTAQLKSGKLQSVAIEFK